jgi:predicted O-methyltransferase YrrM
LQTPAPFVADLIACARAALTPGQDTARENRILSIGALTGLRCENGIFRRANFERGLLLDAIVTAARPREILELGTGRGLGAFAAAEAARLAGLTTHITTVDTLTPDQVQHWPIERDSRREVIHASRRDIWTAHLSADSRGMITEVTGTTTAVLPQLRREGKRFDFIFIDAGHDLYSVVYDLSLAVTLLSPSGCILMDDFAPATDYGFATCLVSAQARRVFQTVEIIVTEGTIYGETEIHGLPRSMVLLTQLRPDIAFSPGKLFFWKVAGKILDLCYRPSLFPLEARA